MKELLIDGCRMLVKGEYELYKSESFKRLKFSILRRSPSQYTFVEYGESSGHIGIYLSLCNHIRSHYLLTHKSLDKNLAILNAELNNVKISIVDFLPNVDNPVLMSCFLVKLDLSVFLEYNLTKVDKIFFHLPHLALVEQPNFLLLLHEEMVSLGFVLDVSDCHYTSYAYSKL